MAAGQHFHLRETNNQVYRGSDLWLQAQKYKPLSSSNFGIDQLLLWLWGGGVGIGNLTCEADF